MIRMVSMPMATPLPNVILNPQDMDDEAAYLYLEDFDQVSGYMDKHMATTVFRGEEQIFMPKSNFDVVTHESVVRRLVQKDEDLFLGEQDADAFVRKIVSEGTQMFATCVFSDLSLTCVKALFEDGLTDAKFPFETADCPTMKGKRRFCTGFIPNQKRFNAAYLHENSENEWDKRIMKPIDFDESLLLGKGAFGNVYKIHIHGGQRSFSSRFNDDDVFAMKVTRQDGTREVSFHRAMAKIPPHQHLLRCLTSFTFSSNYHMVYEKADSDLEKFMEQHTNGRGPQGMESTDLAQQLYGLASALAAIHNHGPSDTHSIGLLSVPGTGPRRAGYIHDIKPENILVFAYQLDKKRKHWFMLSDFSCAKVNDVHATVSGKNRISWKTVSKSGTPVYRAPEAMGKDGKASRPYDLWSLGCVYLELLVWFLEGYESLRRFRDARECHVMPDGREDEGFYFKPTLAEDFRLRDVVVEKIDNVRSRCHGLLRDIADTIPKLLRIDPQQRPTAAKLARNLHHIGKDVMPPAAIDPFVQSSGMHFDPPSLPALPAYESDQDSDLNITGGPFLKIHFSTED